MIEEHIARKCTRCQREHNAPGTVCFLCMGEVIGHASETPQRAGIARKGDLVILECSHAHTHEDSCRIADLLGQVREETGIRFLILDPTMKLARVADCSAIQNLDELDKMLKEVNKQ